MRRLLVFTLLGLLPAAYAGSPPVNTILPDAFGSSYLVGYVLSCDSGAWTPSGLNFAYQWERASDASGTGTAAIPGAIYTHYKLTAADAHNYVRVTVTASDNAGDSASASSVWLQILNSPPVFNIQPVVTGGYVPGATLTVVFSGVTGGATVFYPVTSPAVCSDPDGDALTFSLAWDRAKDAKGLDAAPLPGATGLSYTPTADDLGYYVQFVVTATDTSGASTVALVTWTQIVPRLPVNEIPPVIIGETVVGQTVVFSGTVVGQTVTASQGTWVDPAGDQLRYFYQWQMADDPSGANAQDIPSATDKSYTIPNSEAGEYISVTVTASDGLGGLVSASSKWALVDEPLTVTKLSGGFTFNAAIAAGDTVTIAGNFTGVTTTALAGQTFDLDVGAAKAEYALNAKGTNKNGKPSKSNPPNPWTIAVKVKAGKLSFSAKFNGSFLSKWDDPVSLTGFLFAPNTLPLGVVFGPTATLVKQPAAVRAKVLFNGIGYAVYVPITINCKAGKGGTFKK